MASFDEIHAVARARLFALAYRMLGSRAEAEDALQEGFLRLHAAGRETVRDPLAWLVTVVTRLCLDRLRNLAAERAAYAGPWLPEPLVDAVPPPDADAADRTDDLSLAFTLLLERLAPEERAAFLLHEALGQGHTEIATALGRSEAASRQLLHRARRRLRDAGRQAQAPEAVKRRMVQRYLTALRTGDASGLLALLAEDAVLVSDGGGKVAAAPRPVEGAVRIARLELGLRRKPRFAVTEEGLGIVNGEPGILAWRDGALIAATALETDGERILTLWRVLNPDKLRG